MILLKAIAEWYLGIDYQQKLDQADMLCLNSN